MYVLLLSKTSAEETQESVYCELCSVHIQVHTVTFTCFSHKPSKQCS